MKPLRVLVTGSRDIDAAGTQLVNDVLTAMLVELDSKGFASRDIVIVHGAARGVDSVADKWALRFEQLWVTGISVERHPADWAGLGKRAGHIRNEHMASLGADVCLAFPRRVSPGTWHCVQAAAADGIHVRVYPLPPLPTPQLPARRVVGR